MNYIEIYKKVNNIESNQNQPQLFCLHQFCKTLRKLLLSRRVAVAMVALAPAVLVYLGSVETWSLLLALLLPFLLWMAS